MTNILIDTDILIDFTRNVQDAADFLRRHSQSSVISYSSITHMELLVGCQNKREQREIERFLARFQEIKFTHPITDRALTLLNHYRLSHGLLVGDCLVAATAFTLSIPLATKNVQDYRFIHGLTLVPYP